MRVEMRHRERIDDRLLEFLDDGVQATNIYANAKGMSVSNIYPSSHLQRQEAVLASAQLTIKPDGYVLGRNHFQRHQVFVFVENQLLHSGSSP